MSFKANPKVQKIMVMPINLTFRMLQNRSRVQIWLYENTNLRIEGRIYFSFFSFYVKIDVKSDSFYLIAGHIVGFDEYMNLVLDDAEEYHVKTQNRKTLGRIMLKGDNITLIQNVNPDQSG